MTPSRRFQGTRRHIQAHWPRYYLGYGGGLLAGLAIIWLSLTHGWYGFITLALAILVVLFYFLVASLWVAYQLYDNDRIVETLWKLGQLRPVDRFVQINLGGRHIAIRLAQRLTTGQLVVIDIYNPQLTSNPALIRLRRQSGHPVPDPRLIWLDGHINLLPLPDNSISTVILVETVSELWQHGDRLCLLHELNRILIPGGRLLLAERVRTPTYWLTLGPAAMRLPSEAYWQSLLIETGFQPGRHENMQDLMSYWRAEKRHPGQEQQLVFDFLTRRS